VTAEDGGGARLAVEHLLDLGHRRIGFVGPPEKSVLGESRLRGLNQALKSHRVRLPSELIRLGPSTSAYGYEAVESLLSLPEPPTAIHLTTMQLSTGGVRAISKRGLRLPQDLSVVVAGSAAWYEFWPGGLTSTSLPMAELAGIASNLVFRQPRPAAGESHPFVSLAVRLIERGSTAELGH
jgi:LacI family transcriptional regulator